MKISRFVSLCAATSLFLLQAGLLGCDQDAGEQKQPQAPAVAVQKLQQPAVAPAPKKEYPTLSEEAKNTAAYLILILAMKSDDEESMMEAAKILARNKEATMCVGDWLECAQWLRDKKSVQSIALIELARTVYPQSPELKVAYSRVLGDHKLFGKAESFLHELLKQNPDDRKLLQELGTLYLSADQPEKAAKQYASLKDGFLDAQGEYNFALALLRLKRPEDAEKHLRKAISKAPNFATAIVELAYLLEKKRGGLQEAKKLYEKSLSLDLPSTELIKRLVIVSLRLKEPKKAMEYYRGMEGEEDDLLSCISIFFDFGYAQQGEELLKELCRQDDVPTGAFLLMASSTFTRNGNPEEAKAWLDKIPQGDPNEEKKILLWTEIQQRSHQQEKALETIQEARKRFPESFDVAEFAAHLLSAETKYEAALECVQESLKKWPDSSRLRLLLGSVLSELGKKQEGLAEMEKVLEKEPENPLALNSVGYTLADENKDLDRALKLLLKANQLLPKKTYIVDSLAWAYFRLGKINEAWKCINEAIRLNGKGEDDPAVLDHCAHIALAKGLTSDAIKMWKKVLTMKYNRKEAVRKNLEEAVKRQDAGRRAAPPEPAPAPAVQ